MASKLEHALALAARGFKIFPIAAGAKAPPLWNDWPGRATSDVQEWPNDGYNIGIHCEGLLVIDVDIHKGGIESFKQLDEMLGFPNTRTHGTPTGGLHAIYRLPEGHPGVPNSVGVLGQGLDVRSTGGYIVAPGSQVGAIFNPYHVAVDKPIAPAPEWLVQKLGVSIPRVRTATVDVPDAPAETVDRALAFLKTAEPAVEGAGGDAHTYTVACALRDIGVSPNQAFAALQDGWNERCAPPWELDDLWAKVDNAYRYATGEPGAKTVPASMFQTVGTSAQLPTVRSKARTLKEIATSKRRHPPLIKGYLRKGTFAQIFGAPGEGKTFVALDMAYCVAAGREWMGCKVKPGPVLYLAYEGSLENRAKALMKKYGEDDVPLRFVDATFNLREQAGRQELGQVIAELPAAPVLIVIDTFARAMTGGDENSAQDVGAFNTAVASLIEATGACVLIIHHSGKNKAAGARGSSALNGALDSSIEIDRKQIITDKQREGEAKPNIAFALKQLVVGIDEDGDNETSCVVEPSANVYAGKPLTGKAEHAFNILTEMTGSENTPVARTAWVLKMKDEGLGRSSAYNWPRKLERLGKVMIEDDYARRRLQ